MAQNLSYAEARNYELSTGETADLIALVSSVKPSDWVQATEAQPVGTVVYAYAMGQLRRGVVVKNTPTKTLVALTTAAASMPGGTSVRVQTATELHTTVYVAPAPVAEETTEDEAPAECPARGGPLASDDVCADDECGADEAGERPLTTPATADEESYVADRLARAEASQELASTSNKSPVRTQRERTGSAVVLLLEKVWSRIRENHPELPDVVIVTGAGTTMGNSKWGHFRPDGWTVKAAGESASVRVHEMFMAGETLAKGARQVLQTMLHEGAHALANVREVQDTSRQGRWHNKHFQKLAAEMGLEHRSETADKAHGYSFVTPTEATVAEYSDLLGALDTEIHLMVSLPGWLGGTGDDEDRGGELIGKKPPKGEGSSSGQKLTCTCEEPNIIRASKKVAALMVIRCDDCGDLFQDRS